MNERHLHFNVSTGLWFLVFFIVFGNAMKVAVNRWRIPGLTDLVNNVMGG